MCLFLGLQEIDRGSDPEELILVGTQYGKGIGITKEDIEGMLNSKESIGEIALRIAEEVKAQ